MAIKKRKERKVVPPEAPLYRYAVTNILSYQWVEELMASGEIKQEDIEEDVHVTFELSGGQIFPTHTPAYGYMPPFEKPTIFI